MRACEKCGIVVLAAGRGTRMGGPKALMDVGGGAWWRRQQERLAALGGEVLWIVSPEVGAGMVGGGAGFRMTDVDSGAPMFASVLAGAVGLMGTEELDGLFVLPVDAPAPGAEVWRTLREGAKGRPRVPVCEGKRGHPVYLPSAWVRRVILPAAGDASAVATMRLDTLLAADRELVSVNDRDVLVNLNTPELVAAWRERRDQA